MDAMIVVDMQVGLMGGALKRDLQGVVRRINQLTENVRSRSGTVIFVRHCGRVGDEFEPQAPGWEFLPGLQRHPADRSLTRP
jgi:nicotinamidase-related amidase